jgi:hypothetical protein
VFVGDPWSLGVDAQGDPADLGDEQQDVARPDRVDSDGAPRFLVGGVEAGGRVRAGPFAAEAALRVEPARSADQKPDVWLVLDRAFVSWRRTPGDPLSIELGQVESTFGVEWRQRRAPDRWTVSPSLVSRYTTGTPTGLALRYHPHDLPLSVEVSLTDDGTNTGRFGELVDGDTPNPLPTGAGRVGVGRYAARWSVEAGVSGEYGGQDGVPGAGMYQLGGDLALTAGPVEAVAEVVRVDQDQGEFRVDDRLRATGGYVMARIRAPHQLYPLVRVDRRVGVMELSAADVSHVYLGDVWRATAGLSWMSADTHLRVKVEGVRVIEVGGDLPDDAVLSSAVFSW